MRIEHIAMYVNDLEGAKNFFVKYFKAISQKGHSFRSYKQFSCGNSRKRESAVLLLRMVKRKVGAECGKKRFCPCMGRDDGQARRDS